MVRRTATLLAAVILIPATALFAQNSQCSGFVGNDANICNAAIDGAVVFHPVAGLLVSGGNPSLGRFGTLGGFPHFTFAVRVNATQLHTPDLNYDGTGNTVAAGDKVFAPAPVVEASLGIFKGLGTSGLLGIDLLGSAQLLPTDQIDNLSVDKDATTIGSVALGFGYGARVGITNQKAIVPAVSVSLMRRNIPTITYGDITNGDQYRFSVGIDVTNLRAVAGYGLGILDVGAGLGWDKYTGSADIEFTPTVGPTQSVSKDLDQTRTLAFIDAGLNLGILNVVAEGGYQFGKDLHLSTNFDNNDPKDNRLFGSAAIRFSF